MTNPTQILIVDDEHAIRHLIEEYLSDYGYKVRVADNAAAAYAAVKMQTPAIIVLDIAMPGEDGMSVARKLRSLGITSGIIMLTAKSEVSDRIIGLEAGADDYLTKPFHLGELLARIRSLQRRQLPPTDPNKNQGKIQFDNWCIDVDARILINRNGDEVALTGMEFELLLLLVNHAGEVVSREEISASFGTQWNPLSRKIDVLVLQLRNKLEENPRIPRLLKTVRGSGYVLSVSTAQN